MAFVAEEREIEALRGNKVEHKYPDEKYFSQCEQLGPRWENMCALVSLANARVLLDPASDVVTPTEMAEWAVQNKVLPVNFNGVSPQELTVIANRFCACGPSLQLRTPFAECHAEPNLGTY